MVSSPVGRELSCGRCKSTPAIFVRAVLLCSLRCIRLSSPAASTSPPGTAGLSCQAGGPSGPRVSSPPHSFVFQSTHRGCRGDREGTLERPGARLLLSLFPAITSEGTGSLAVAGVSAGRSAALVGDCSGGSGLARDRATLRDASRPRGAGLSSRTPGGAARGLLRAPLRFAPSTRRCGSTPRCRPRRRRYRAAL